MIVVVDVVVIAHVETVDALLARVVRVPAFLVADRSSFSYSMPCFSRRPYIVPLDLCVVPGSWRLLLVVWTL